MRLRDQALGTRPFTSDNYFQRPAMRADPAETARFPRNHVRYPAKLKPIEWLNALQVRKQSGPLSIERAVLAAFDRAHPMDACLGTAEELSCLRSAVVSFVQGFDRNPHLLGIGRVLIKKILTKYLAARCAVLKFYSENQSFIQTHGKLRAPFIITGLPRTGSTLLQRLMAEDPDARSPLTFEMESPLPPMSQDGDPLGDPRIARSGDALKLLARIAPGFLEKLAESHLWSATEFEESYIYMLAHNGVAVMDAANAGEEYVQVQQQGLYHAPVLRYERMFFTMLDAYRPAKSHWVLQAPNYAPAFPWMAKEYEDARIVLTHRNPLVVLPSVCRLMESWCIAFTRDGFFDKHGFAKIVSEILKPNLSVPLQYRRDNPDRSRRIFDCMYDELFADPVAMVKRIYSWFDLEVTPTFEQRMRTYLVNNRQGKYGRHSYSLQEYGLDPQGLLESNYEYMQRYGFTVEDVVRSKRATSLR
jgi:hypothetical protein